MIEEEKYIFVSEWFDKASYLSYKFFLTFYPCDNTVELYDRRNKKLFLKRTTCNTVEKRDFYLQNVVNIFSRKIHLIDYADSSTQKLLESKNERTVVIFKSHAIWTLGQLIDLAQRRNFVITKLHIVHMTKSYLEILKSFIKTEYSSISDFLNKNVIVIEFVGENVVAVTDEILHNIITLREFGQEDASGGILYQSCAVAPFSKPEEALLSAIVYVPKSFKQVTCSIIKPHAVRAGFTGKILMDIANAKFMITAMTMLEMDYDQAEHFHALYKGVVTEYPGMVAQLSSGLCIVLCIETSITSEKRENSQTFREFVGPADPEIARQIRPQTLRAKYGINKIMNAVHCTDLPEDGELELRCCFNSIR